MGTLTRLAGSLPGKIAESLRGGSRSIAGRLNDMSGGLRNAETTHRELQSRLPREFDRDGTAFFDSEFGVQIPRSAPPYSTVPLRREYAGENKRGSWAWGFGRVKYYDETRRQKFMVTVRDGLLYDSRGKLLSTDGNGWSKGSYGLFVMDEQGRVFVTTKAKPGHFHHSTLVAGEPVAAAGTIRVSNGVVEQITDASGHYRPDRAHTLQMIHRLRSLGVPKLDPHNIQFTFGR
ncbi:hypothetical protein [Nocardia fusca]|uniref:hypothetical protein n=1 Tax=Nocardia fusca TaxID=941183 RepID=UPI0007A7666A|nr:hypothetical protein [Nocardia fusca]